MTKAFGYPLAWAVDQSKIRGITLHKKNIGELVNGYVLEDLFLTIMEDDELFWNMLEILDLFCEILGPTFSKLKVIAYWKSPCELLSG